MTGNAGKLLLVLRFLACLLLPVVAGAAGAADPLGELRKEKVRLMEMRRKAQEAAAELTETLRKEKRTRARVTELRSRLAKRQEDVARIDRRLDALGAEMERVQAEVRAIEGRHARARGALEGGARATFLAERERDALLPSDPFREERLRYFAGRALGEGKGRFDRLAAARDRKEEQIEGIEHRIELSEQRMERERKEAQALKARQEEERRKLSQLEAQKKRKASELSALRKRIARMESLVTRIERLARTRERQERQARRRERVAPREGEKEAESGKPAGKEGGRRDRLPTRFAAIPGGMRAPLEGRVVSPFGRQHDEVFDVTVETRGVEIEGGAGAAIRAVAGGEVVFLGPVPGYGRVLILQHGSGLFSVYGKAESFGVRQGQVVDAGEEVGRLPSESNGKSVLYLELRAGGTAVDPAAVIPLSR